MNNDQTVQRQLRSKIIVIVATLLGILLIYNVITLYGELKYKYHHYGYNQSDMEYTLRDSDYAELINMVTDNIACGKNTVTDISEYTALAYYYESVMYYDMYKETNDELAATMKVKAEYYKSQLVSDRFKKEAEKIDQNRPNN